MSTKRYVVELTPAELKILKGVYAYLWASSEEEIQGMIGKHRQSTRDSLFSKLFRARPVIVHSSSTNKDDPDL